MTGKPGERHAQLELCIPYVFGRLNPGNRKQFEAHLATGCELCRKELAGLHDATALLPLLLKQESPSSGLKQRVVSRAASKKAEPARIERPSPPRQGPVTPATQPQRSWYLPVGIAFGVLVIVGLAIFVNDLVRSTGVQEKRIADLEKAVKEQEDLLTPLKGNRIEVVSLQAIEAGSSCYGKILWDSLSRNAIVQAGGLAATPEGKEYQLWMLKESKYFSVGEFQLENAEEGILRRLTLPVGERQQIEGFTLTLEPSGGSPQPTGAIFLRWVGSK